MNLKLVVISQNLTQIYSLGIRFTQKLDLKSNLPTTAKIPP